jgi:hypothetical protein
MAASPPRPSPGGEDFFMNVPTNPRESLSAGQAGIPALMVPVITLNREQIASIAFIASIPSHPLFFPPA